MKIAKVGELHTMWKAQKKEKKKVRLLQTLAAATGDVDGSQLFDYLGIADGVSIARVWACQYSE